MPETWQISTENLLLAVDDGMNIFNALKYLKICDNIRVTTAKNGDNALLELVRTDYDITIGCHYVIYEEMARHKTAQIHYPGRHI